MARKSFQYNLEALRGWVAILVVLTHCFGFSQVLNGANRIGIWQYNFPGHLAVMIFFALSGFVIGLSTERLSWQTVKPYLIKRFFRLYPIYVVCIVAALLVTTHTYSWWQVIANLSFLQVTVAESLYEVGVNWSLNYEVLFYILFIPLSIYAIHPIKAGIVVLLTGLFLQFILAAEQPALYCYGFCHWLAGLWLAKETVSKPHAFSNYTLSGLSCIILAFPSLNAVSEIMRFQLHMDDFGGKLINSPIAISLSDFSYLPFSLLLLATFVGRRLRGHSLLMAYVLLVPCAYLVLQLRHASTTDWLRVAPAYGAFVVGIVLLLVGFLRRPQEDTRKFSEFFIQMGGISYGIYLVHFLVLLAVAQWSFLPGGTSFSLLIRTGVVLIVTIAAGFILEKLWHPMVMNWIKPVLTRPPH